MTVAARREREREERRSLILDAAEKVFDRKGFDQATMDDIAVEAELSKGSLYLYFKNKDDLFTGLSTRMARHMVARFEALAVGEPTGIAAIRAMLAYYTEFISAHPQHFRIIMGRFASGDLFDPEVPSFAEHRAQVGRIVDAFVTAIERGKSDSTIRCRLNPVQTSSQLWGALIGTMLIHINGDKLERHFDKPVDYEKFGDGFIELVCNGLSPDISTNAEPDGESSDERADIT